ncbi:MAG: RbsD/FucU family protein [Pseudoflavonifractor sp.]|nr:RbsD/FucU family protein [Pseudoflavonifractor sp.]
MISGALIHPDLMRVLSLCGHGDQILIADGNYPLASKSGTAELVYLGLTPGLPSVTEVLAAIQSVIRVEAAHVMTPEDGSTPEVLCEFASMLGGTNLQRLGRMEFYDACCQSSVRLAISTGERRTYANLLLTVGVM